MKLKKSLILFLFAVCLSLALRTSLSAAEPLVTLTVEAGHPGAAINPAMWGIFFEDINFGADGGLYAELVKNGSFEFPEPLMGWTKLPLTDNSGTFAVQEQTAAHPTDLHFLRINSTSDQGAGIANEGFRGIGVSKGEAYDFSVNARAASNGHPQIKIELVNPDGHVMASGKISDLTADWKNHDLKLRAQGTELKARLNVIVEGRGEVDVDRISLFPKKTWKNRPHGLRADMVQLLADMKPGFMRFPGGCIVEGSQLDRRYQWKNTIGDPADRKLLINRWNYEFKHRPTPDYFQSFGLGFFEFFQLCDDIGAQPLPIINCGMACQFNTGQLAPLDELDSYIQDALDLIDFANAPVTNSWGARRAAMGHPESFHMKMMGVGNEQWGPQYIERYARFAEVLKARHPEIMLVTDAGPSPDDERFQYLWPKLRGLHADIVDEHCYARPDWFFANTHRYDHYDRQGPKVFMGEYAAQSVGVVSPDNRNNWECALSEAAYMTGLERNADVVRMASYAPLFAHVDAWQWKPDMIWCDNLHAYGTTDYYVQQLFSRNCGDFILPIQLEDSRPAPTAVGTNQPLPRIFADASFDQKQNEIVVKVVNATGEPTEATVNLPGVQVGSRGKTIVLASAHLTDENSFAAPRNVSPREEALTGLSSSFEHTFPAYSVTVLRVPESTRTP